MEKPGRWWRGKSTPAKVEAYTRWCYYFIATTEIFTFGPTGFGEVSTPLATALLLIVTVHALLCMVTIPASLDWVLGRRPRPVRRLVVLSVSTLVAAVTVLALALHAPGGGVGRAGGQMYFGMIAFGLGIASLGVRRHKRLPGLVVGVAVAAALICVPVGQSGGEVLAAGLAVLISGGFLAFTSGFSVWLLRAVYALDEAKETRARLAVAEERLRFGRDLHDILGRNLAVIALKSELAVQLARRSRPEAVEQMIEAQRIAQESQREVREVVRGYRGVAVDTELAGAQGVLTAAGIDCAVSGTAAAGLLPGEARSALGWVVREAATNVLRHGDARTCVIALTVDGDRARLTVENDGVRDGAGATATTATSGTTVAGARTPGSGGSGLAGLRERLAVVDGSLSAGPVVGGRFRVVAEVPVRGAGGSPGQTGGSGRGAGSLGTASHGEASLGADGPEREQEQGPGPGLGHGLDQDRPATADGGTYMTKRAADGEEAA
ncbi:sensor histidine kinase [Streptomyces sp. NA04227]|uniref:sensor histidine kinase n=1 Tax=Streptomyces sp. NA04227 TaxID=2742136 RepID=UPI0015923F94|nr:sensor histidine kinase [Streptomyces sp. NA04227]QKW10971.1 sensor histidine kinase [Streptomyces sp. NA04227]